MPVEVYSTEEIEKRIEDMRQEILACVCAQYQTQLECLRAELDRRYVKQNEIRRMLLLLQETLAEG